MTRSILVVDDDAVMCRCIDRHFNRRGWTTGVATTPSEAMERLQATRYTWMLADYYLEYDTADELLSFAQQLDVSPSTVLMSGVVTNELKLGAMTRGVKATIDKPFELAMLERVFDSVDLKRIELTEREVEIVRMTEKLTTIDAVADALGVKKATIYKAWHRMYRSTGLTAPAIHGAVARGEVHVVTRRRRRK